MAALNSGGSLPALSTSGIQYGKDQLFSGGDVLRTDEEISGTSEPSLYQTARYGNVSYKFPDLPCGEYFVDLHFAEIVFTNGPAGMRVFDVHMQGLKVRALLDSFDDMSELLVDHTVGQYSIWQCLTCYALNSSLDHSQ